MFKVLLETETIAIEKMVKNTGGATDIKGTLEASQLPKEIQKVSEASQLPKEVQKVSEASQLPKEIQSVSEVTTETLENQKVHSKIEKVNTYSDLDSMKQALDKTYGEIKEAKPPNSPNITKWFNNGGTIKIDETDGKQVWTYIDKAGRKVSYMDGHPVFPPEAKHKIIKDINIEKFTGDRNEDKKIYLKKLEEQYGLTEIPDGYTLHHDAKNGNMQLVKTDWHKEFTHIGGHSLFKEVE